MDFFKVKLDGRMMQHIRLINLAVALAVAMASCTPAEKVRRQTFKGPEPRSLPPAATPPGGDIPADMWGQKESKPYTVAGVTYYPLESAKGFTEEGTASWYGPDFHGKNTANGEEYNQEGYTAAHKTLPFNTMVRVENMANGKSVVVRVNDRGPFKSERIIDLSHRAALDLGLTGSGTAKVRLAVAGAGGSRAASGEWHHSKMGR